MKKNEAAQLAKEALKTVGVGDPSPVADTTVLFKNEDGSFSVTDNGEEVVCQSPEWATKIIIENLTGCS